MDLDPYAIENLRRSVVMLTPGQVAGLSREDVLALLNELQRLREPSRSP